MSGLTDDPSRKPSDPREDPEALAYALLSDEESGLTGSSDALAYAVLALLREMKSLRRDIAKLNGRPPTMKGK